MTFIKQYLNAILGLVVLGLLVANAFGVRAYNESLREDGRAEIRAEWEAATNAALIVATGLCAVTLTRDLFSGLRRIWST